MDCKIVDILNGFCTISLENMKSVRLMNRIDTKYLTDIDTLYSIMSMAKDYYLVQSVESNLIANYSTCYFDTMNHDMYLQHHNGRAVRTKIRIRKYVDSDIMFLEIKKKNNKGRTDKNRIETDNWKLDDECKYKFINDNTSYKVESLKPQLQNRFQRITLVNKDMSERLTIDTMINFHNVVTENDYDMGKLVVVEVKRGRFGFSPIKSILNKYRVFQSGFSKYCIGSSLTDNTLKQNRFKTKERYIDKIVKN